MSLTSVPVEECFSAREVSTSLVPIGAAKKWWGWPLEAHLLLVRGHGLSAYVRADFRR